jgi:hypothetical protein
MAAISFTINTSEITEEVGIVIVQGANTYTLQSSPGVVLRLTGTRFAIRGNGLNLTFSRADVTVTGAIEIGHVESDATLHQRLRDLFVVNDANDIAKLTSIDERLAAIEEANYLMVISLDETVSYLEGTNILLGNLETLLGSLETLITAGNVLLNDIKTNTTV